MFTKATSLRACLVLAGLALTTACATSPEDSWRRIDLAWDLTPETTERFSEYVDQGDIFFEWRADARATHSANVNGQTVYLTPADSRFGQLYCAVQPSEVCFEDRDGDGKLERQWKLERISIAPRNIAGASNVAPINPVALNALGDERRIVATQSLGLLYNGPFRGILAEGDQFDQMLGDFSLGWHGGKSAPRDPTGAGWQPVNFLVFVQTTQAVTEVLVKEIGVRYAASKADASGRVEMSMSAMPVEGARLDQKFEINAQPLPEALDDLEV